MRLAGLALGLIAAVAFGQLYVGRQVITPTANPYCIEVRTGSKYAVQANLAAQQPTSSAYLSSSVDVFNNRRYNVSLSGAMPTDGGYFAEDGGVHYWQKLPATKLKDTDVYSFVPTDTYRSFCYNQGTLPDGGPSSMTLTINEIVQ